MKTPILTLAVTIFGASLPFAPAYSGWLYDASKKCRIWDPSDEQGQLLVQWSGECRMDSGLGYRNAEGGGTLVLSSGGRILQVATGYWQRGAQSGEGTYEWKSTGGHYTGTFVDGVMQGRGVMVWPDGARYDGIWKNDQMHGRGEYTFVNGDNYSGIFENGRFHGEGRYTWWASRAQYSGAWMNGVAHGQGIKTENNRLVFDGVWNRGCFVAGGATVGRSEEDCRRQLAR